jgi:DNA-binding response OmpR family regulator
MIRAALRRAPHKADVAVCDPDDVSALLVAEVLTTAGHHVDHVGVEEILDDPLVADVLVLADPCGTGPAVTALIALRDRPDGDHISVLVVTQTRDPDIVTGLLEAGADAVLPRPWGPRMLRAHVAAQLRRHRLACVRDNEPR